MNRKRRKKLIEIKSFKLTFLSIFLARIFDIPPNAAEIR